MYIVYCRNEIYGQPSFVAASIPLDELDEAIEFAMECNMDAYVMDIKYNRRVFSTPDL